MKAFQIVQLCFPLRGRQGAICCNKELGVDEGDRFQFKSSKMNYTETSTQPESGKRNLCQRQQSGNKTSCFSEASALANSMSATASSSSFSSYSSPVLLFSMPCILITVQYYYLVNYTHLEISYLTGVNVNAKVKPQLCLRSLSLYTT